MAQIFGRGATPLGRIAVLGIVLLILGGGYVYDLIFKSPYVNGQGMARRQPIPFSHAHHARDLGIDCRYCHTEVESGAFAGIPPLHTCMTCHSQIWTGAPMLEPVRRHFRTGDALAWTRVNRLPDFVYFNHSIHVKKGVACITCHGSVGDMPLMQQASTLYMKWCLECHRNPEKYVGEPKDVFRPTAASATSTEEDLNVFRRDHPLNKLTSCYTCHR